MLFEFHRKENAKKPGTVHATYLITGSRKVETAPQTNGVHSQDGEDTVMQSSPPLPSSSAPKPEDTVEESVPTRSIMLVKEEHLEQAKHLFDSISSIHIYSLEANGLSDIQALTECNRKIGVSYATEDPLQDWKQYGTIQNPNVKRRTRQTAPPPPPPVDKNAMAKTKPFATTAKAKEAEMKAEPKEASNKSTPEPEKKAAPKPVQAKRQNSDIFKSFAKGKTKEKQESQSSAEASPAPPEPEDEPMGGFSDDDDLAIDALEEQQPEVSAPAGKSKREREAELQAMMDDDDDDDEPMQDANTPINITDEPAAESGKVKLAKEEEQKETVTVENGRRRGKRRIMKKVTAKDEDGYLGMLIDSPAAQRIKIALLTLQSDTRGTSVGVLLRRRARPKKDQNRASRLYD